MSNATMPLRRTILAIALAPAFLIAGCEAQNDAALAEQVAIAKDAADRAVKAQKAAERAASTARSQSGSSSFGEDEVIEEVDDSSGDDSSSGAESVTEEISSASIPR